MTASERIAFVGGGTMAEAIVRGILRDGLYAPEQIAVGEPLPARRKALAGELGVRTYATALESVADADVVVLAVKPQVMLSVASELAGQIAEDALLVSIVAGMPIETLRVFCVPAIVRVMPNTPAQIGEGISVWVPSCEVSQAQSKAAAAIVGALGQGIQANNEKYIDMTTAVSGSGPGYVFLFIEALTDAAVQIGFARPVAKQLALQTVRGAAAYAQSRSDDHLATLRNGVTSPGGTTAAGIHELERGGLRSTVTNAVLAAYHKAKALGEN